MISFRIKDVAQINRRALPEDTDPAHRFLYIDISSVDGLGNVTLPAEAITFATAPSRARRLAPPGSVLVSTVRTYLRAIATVPNSPDPLVFSTGFAVLEAKPEMDGRFLGYYCRSQPFIDDVVARSTGVSYPAINPGDIGSLPVTVPPLDEQHHIADYLDAETARIDRLVGLRENQVHLFRERFQSLRRFHVTGAFGIGGTGTEIDWLGRVPECWPTPTINKISRFVMGTTFPHDYQGHSSGDYPFIKVGDFQHADELGYMKTAENWVSRATAKELGARIVPAGSVLYARVGAALLLNRRRVVTRASIVDDNVRAIHFSQGNPKYWMHLLSLLDMGQLVNPGPVPSIGENQVASVRVPNPPEATQSAVADELEQQQRTLHAIESVAGKQVAALAERRQALITAAVTGQFDVSSASGRNVTEGV